MNKTSFFLFFILILLTSISLVEADCGNSSCDIDAYSNVYFQASKDDYTILRGVSTCGGSGCGPVDDTSNCGDWGIDNTGGLYGNCVMEMPANETYESGELKYVDFSGFCSYDTGVSGFQYSDTNYNPAESHNSSNWTDVPDDCWTWVDESVIKVTCDLGKHKWWSFKFYDAKNYQCSNAVDTVYLYGTPQYGDPGSEYWLTVSDLEPKVNSSFKVYVKHKVSGFWPWEGDKVEYVGGAKVFVDGSQVAETKSYDGFWGFLPGVGGPPYASVTISEIGQHVVYAKIDGEVSKELTVDVQGFTDEGSGNYPINDPGDDEYYYKLWSDKVTLQQSGEVTFKIFRMEDGDKVGAVNGDIYVDGERVGETSSWPWQEPFYTHRFESAGSYDVHALKNDKRTGVLPITVLEQYEEKDPVDPGELNLTVTVEDKQRNALSGIKVLLEKNDEVKESVFTDSNVARLHPKSGVEYRVSAVDPSNEYITDYTHVNITSDYSVRLSMAKAGGYDSGSQSIELIVDGNSQRNITLHKGVEHTIRVVDDKGIPVRGAIIYVDGNKIGSTDQGVFQPAQVKHDFSVGEHRVRAEYEGMVDVVGVEVKDKVDPDDPDATVLVAIPEGSNQHVIGNLTVKRHQDVLFQVTEQGDASSIWDWTKISDATISINGEAVGKTSKTTFNDIIFGFGGAVGYVHSWNDSGVYQVNASTPSSSSQVVAEGTTTQSLWVTVTNEEYEGGSGGNILTDHLPDWLAQFLITLAKDYPILGIALVDQVIYLLLLVFGAIFVLRLVVNMLLRF